MNDKEFSERVKKTFGNLLTSVSPHTPKPSSLSNPLWSLTGTQIEKREWRRDQDTTDRDNNPCASSFDDFVTCARKNSRQSLKSYKKELDDDIKDHLGDDDDVDVDDDVDDKIGGLDDWDLRGSIGLDSTLDNEEEEDAYDKVALGRENASDRLYMSDIANNNIPNSVSQDDLSPDSGTRRRDPRANHLAARIRLKEDDAETLRTPPASAEKESVSTAGDSDKVKPILKRKDRESTSKPSKRVSFDPKFVKEGISSLSDKEITACKIPSDTTTLGNHTTLGNQSGLNEIVRQVPDYVQNPSKYTCYSLDSTNEMNVKSDSGTCLDVLDMVKKLQNSGSRSEPPEDALADLPNSVTFVPKKKTDTGKSDAVHGESTNDGDSDLKYPSKKSTLVTGFVDEDIRECEVGDMEVDDPEKGAELGVTSGIQGRQYRTKSQGDEQE